MRHLDFQGMCELVGDGEVIWVENQTNHQQGRVTGCHNQLLEVNVEGHSETWEHEVCTEMTHGFKVDYEETLKHPHEYDSHLD
ncbi:MAG: hypothetical protein C0618_10510 [Desulfuromonas sp.]|nr:MAG: hypothetical protein C0618_10510 [Desulfuromonas sp.]